MGQDLNGPRKPRADVMRNRSRILDVAARHFDAFGVTTSLEAIAKEAGVGTGTLYRHFASREALLATLLRARRDNLTTTYQRTPSSEDGINALRRWMRELENYLSLYRGLSVSYLDSLRKDDPDNPLAQSCDDLIAITDRLLMATQRTGCARSDFNGRDLFLLASSIAWLRSMGALDGATLARMRAATETGYIQPKK